MMPSPVVPQRSIVFDGAHPARGNAEHVAGRDEVVGGRRLGVKVVVPPHVAVHVDLRATNARVGVDHGVPFPHVGAGPYLPFARGRDMSVPLGDAAFLHTLPAVNAYPPYFSPSSRRRSTKAR